jgi:hypothetical protein
MSITPPDNFYIANSNKELSQRQGVDFSKATSQGLQRIRLEHQTASKLDFGASSYYFKRVGELLLGLKSIKGDLRAELIEQEGVLPTLNILDSANQLVKAFPLDLKDSKSAYTPLNPDGLFSPIRQWLTSLQQQT